jgi:P4 family phage/plasmid primase-like protien
MQNKNKNFSVIERFCAAGLYLVPIPPHNGIPSKAPIAKGWNKPRCLNNPDGYSVNTDDFKSCNSFNFGLYHGTSCTLALDLDDVALASKVFEDTANIQLSDWLNDDARAEIRSPKANRGKLLFKLPSGLNVSLKQLKKPKNDNPKEYDVIFELRCGNCQDVIYGQHPEGGAYQFVGNPAAIPPIPAVLLDMLLHWSEWKPCLDSALGIEIKPPKIQPRKPQQGDNLPGRRNPIDEFNQARCVTSVLLDNGYTQFGLDRFIRPGSESKAPGAVLLRNCADGVERIFSHGGDALNDGFGHDAWDCFRLLECGGDFVQALNWSPEITKHNQRLHMKAGAGQSKAQAVSAAADLITTPEIENSAGKKGTMLKRPAVQVDWADDEIAEEAKAAPQAPMVDNADQEDRPPARMAAIQALLASVKNIGTYGLNEVCSSLGWSNSESKSPKQKHYKVAIVHTIIETAKENNWHIIYDAGFFYIFDGAYWVALQDAEVKQLLKSASIKMGFTEIECRDANFVDRLFQQAVQDGFFVERNFKKQSIINLKNGSLVLNDSGVMLKPFDHRDFLTHQLDFDYDPDAVNHRFLDYLAEVLPDADTQRTLQQVTGYLFVKGLKMERVFFLFGEGANGKSVFFEILSGVIGTDNISNYSLESLTDDKGYHRAKIKDKIVNYGTDIKLTRIDAGMFKTLASGEPIEARLPYGDPFMMTDYAKLIFNVNKLDNANIEHTHGFYRRLLIIPFNKTIPDEQQDKDLHKKILVDRAGILNWIIKGAEEVIKNRTIEVSDECELTKSQFIKESDSVAMFEVQMKETLRGSIYFSTVSDSYNEYKAFCNDAGHKHPLGRNGFSKRMESLGFEKRKTETGWHLEKHYFDKKV